MTLQFPFNMKTKLLSVTLALLLLCPYFAFAQNANLAPDLIIINANIRTLDNAHPRAEALAVMNNRIITLGTSADIKRLANAKTKIIDAQNRIVLPGFNDAHTHFLSGGFQLASVDLRDAATPQEFARRIGEFAKKTPKGRWITGGDWDHERWARAPLPTKELIDSVTPDTPVFVNRLDGHMSLANSAALKLAGVTKETKDVAGGVIVRDKDGEPTGILKDAAMSYVNRVIPDASFDEKLTALKSATDYAASLGVTSVTDVSAGNDVGVYQTLLQRGQLKTRVYAASPISIYQRLANTGVRAAFGSHSLRIGGLKGFADGSLGSTTALFFDAYNDAPDTRGIDSGDEMKAMQKNVEAADKAGLQIMIHAIGDQANNQILNIYEAVERANEDALNHRFRIEHAQHIAPSDIARFAKLKVIASVQPFHIIDDGRWAEKRIGANRIKTTYPFRSLLDSGAMLAFGSDWTVAPLNPLLGIYAAVTRRTLDNKNPDGWIPAQKITVEEAVRAYTLGSAFAEFQEQDKGTLTVGKLADFVLLDKDIFTINPHEIDKAKVVLTVMDGRVVYEAK